MKHSNKLKFFIIGIIILIIIGLPLSLWSDYTVCKINFPELDPIACMFSTKNMVDQTNLNIKLPK